MRRPWLPGHILVVKNGTIYSGQPAIRRWLRSLIEEEIDFFPSKGYNVSEGRVTWKTDWRWGFDPSIPPVRGTATMYVSGNGVRRYTLTELPIVP